LLDYDFFIEIEILKEVITDQFSLPELFVPEISDEDVSRENVLKGLGMTVADADNFIIELIDRFTKECIQLIHPQTCYSVYSNLNFDLKQHQIIVSDQVFETGKTVTQMLKKSEMMVLFACTSGSGVTEYSKKLISEGHNLEGLLVDLIGSELAEAIADYLHDFIEAEFGRFGLKVTNRFSPGYCNWLVSEQHKLFSLLPANSCGIQLTASSLMIPIKSVSGIIGAGSHMKRVAYKCNVCNDKKCIMRK